MAQELFCPQHGPYDAKYGKCPYCENVVDGRPASPPPLDRMEDLPTDLGLKGSSANQSYGMDNEPTILKGKRPLDIDDEVTRFGSERPSDVTIIEGKKEDGPQAILWVKDGGRRGTIYHLSSGRKIIGRETGDIILNDPKVTRDNHAVLAFKEDHYVISDSLSGNGTWVNGIKIGGETPLNENDVIKIGDVVFVLKILDLGE